MALSFVELLGDGANDVFTFQIPLGFLSRDDISVEVSGEVDGTGAQAQREIEWITDGVIRILGDIVPNQVPIIVKRTVNKTVLENTYEDGSALTEGNLDSSFKQTLMAVQELLDGRIDAFAPEAIADLLAEGTAQVALAAAEADRAYTEADRAWENANRSEAYGDLLVGVNNVSSYPSRLSVTLINVDPGVNFITTEGYSTQGDGGHGRYRRVASQPAGHSGWMQSLDGAYWELHEFLIVNEKQFGGIGDGVADDTSACQNAIDYGLFRDGNVFSAMAIETVLIGPKLLTSDTLHMGYHAFNRCQVRGQGIKHRAENGMMGTAIIASFTDRPIVNMQGGRGSSLRDIWLEGALDYSAVQAVHATYAETLESTWDAMGGNNRYTPYAGVTFGAYDGNQTERYPTVTYPAWTGVTTQYDKPLGSNPECVNVGVRGVNTAFSGKPGNDPNNEDFISIVNCTIEYCKYGISMSHHQSRNVEVRNLIGANIWTVFTSEAHGIQQGRFGGVVDNCSFGGFIGRLFEFGETSIIAPVTFTNLYVEGLVKLGTLTNDTAAEMSITFQSCTFSFTTTDDIGVPAAMIDGVANSADIIFRGCSFSGFPSIASFIAPNVRFEDVRLTPGSRNATDIPATELARAYMHNALAGGLLVDQQSMIPQIIRFTRYETDTGVANGDVQCADGTTWEAGRQFNVPIYMYDFTPSTARHTLQNARIARGIYARSLTSNFESITLVGRVLTMTMSSVDLDGVDEYLTSQGLEPGDVFRCRTTGTAFLITNRTGNVITSEMQTNYRSDGLGSYVPTDGWDVTANYALEFVCCRNFTPSVVTYADFTDASADMTNVGRADGYSVYIPTEILPGDWYGVRDDADRVVLNNDRLVASVAGDGATITLSGNARKTATGVGVSHWIARPPAGFMP